MNKLIALLALTTACAGGDIYEDEPALGQSEQALIVEVDGTATVGQNTALNDFSRCTLSQSASAVCRVTKPIQLPTDTIMPGGVVRYQMAVSNTAGSNFGASRSQVVQYIQQLDDDLQATGNSGSPPWIARYVDLAFDPYNIYFAQSSIAGTPSAGETRWEYYVRPSYGNCVTVPENGAGQYQVCNTVTILVDWDDLRITQNLPSGTLSQQTQFDRENLRQAIAHGIRLAVGITGNNTAERRLELGRVQTNLEITQGQRDTLLSFENPIYGGWEAFSFADYQ